MSDVTQILAAIQSGDSSRADQILPLVYDELRRLADVRLRMEKAGQTLQPTALVHEAYLRLVGNEIEATWKSRGHFFGAAAEAMRRILVERARAKGRTRRGGDMQRVDIDLDNSEAEQVSENLLALNEALERLEALSPNRAQIVKLRYFAGLTIADAAKAMNISTATADRHWAFARAWLYAEIGDSRPDRE